MNERLPRLPAPEAVDRKAVRSPVRAVALLVVMSCGAVLLGAMVWGMVEHRLDDLWDAVAPTLPASPEAVQQG